MAAEAESFVSANLPKDTSCISSQPSAHHSTLFPRTPLVPTSEPISLFQDDQNIHLPLMIGSK
eukprot:PDM83126.1 hypothetical protein PRIPAC_37519 [Pristionchus pacificus]